MNPAAAEYQAVADWLRPGAVLDCPFGTGRFMALYRSRGLPFIGWDKSGAMLGQARRRDPDAILGLGDVCALPFADRSFATAVCVRLLPWLDLDHVSRALGELIRVADTVIVSVRLGVEGVRCHRGSVTHDAVAFADAIYANGAAIIDRRTTAITDAGEFIIVRLARL